MNTIYKLGEYEVDSLSRQLRLNGEIVALAQKPFDVLLYLVSRAGQVVTKDELMEAIWPGAFVEESNLTQSIFLLRKAFSDRASGSRYIITVPGRGYQLGVAPVLLAEAEPDKLDKSEVPSPVIDSHPEIKPASIQPVSILAKNQTTASRPNRRTATLVALGVIFCIVALVTGWWLWRRPSHAEPVFALKRLTNSGDVQATAVSVSGKYVAFVSKSALGSEAISVSDLRSGSSREIFHDDAEVISDITFSPDDLYLYYRSYAKTDSDEFSSEHRLPLMGGDPILVLRDIDGPVSFVDGGKRFCFWRGSPNTGFSVISASVENGKDETILAHSGRPMPVSLACAPDGEKAALSNEVGGISILDFKTGSRQPFGQPRQGNAQGKEVSADLQWKADGSALIGSVFSPSDPYWRLFSISYPEGIRDRITHDFDSYHTPGMTTDGNTIVARQGVANAQFQSFDLPLLAENPEVISFPWTDFLGWRDEGRIVGSAADGGIKIKEIATGQENSIQTPAGMHFLQPNGCGAGALVASGTGNTKGAQSVGGSQKEIVVWHMDADGSRLEQLTHGPEDILPACTPDGKWVLYADNSFRAKAAIYRVSAEGGAPEKVGEGSVWFAISHKGDKLAWVDNEGHTQTLILADLMSGRQLACLPIPPQLHISRSLSFSPDDQQAFLTSHGEPSDSIYEMELHQTRSAGPTPVKQIEFRGAHVAAIAVSPTGKHLGVVTVKPVSDAVLLQRSIQ